MSTGIVSSKEGHDESHIDDTKLETKFWNDVNKVTIRLAQKYWHRDCFDYRGKTSSTSLWTLGSMTKRDKHTMWWWTMHSFERLKGVAWLMRVDNHGDQLNTQLIEMIYRQVPCSKVTTKLLPFICKMIPFPFSPSWLMSASFHFYELK